ARTGALAHPGLVSSAALWLRESRSPRTSRGAHRAIAHYHHPRQDELGPATPPPARHDRENSQNSSFTRTHARLYRPAGLEVMTKAPPQDDGLARQFARVEEEIGKRIHRANLLA